MALTITTSDWTNANVRKTLSFQAALVSKLRIYSIKVTFGGSDNYATNGNTVDLSLGGRIDNVIACEILHSNKGLLLQYAPSANGVASTGKLKAYGQKPTDTTGTVIALEELDNSDTAVNSMTVRCKVIGF